MTGINRKPVSNHFSLPPRIQRLGELAFNLWWVWNPVAQNLFAQIDKFLWEKTNHNPVAFLHQVQRAQLNSVTSGKNFLEAYDRILAAFDDYMRAEKTWFQDNHLELRSKTAAYFSFEFGLHESLPVYAGGLGVLAGDHLKEASDLGIPLVAVGFIYNQGYFVQKISEDGWQETRNQILNFQQMPILELTDDKGKPVKITLELTGRIVTARIWQVQVGRIPLIPAGYQPGRKHPIGPRPHCQALHQ